MGRPVVAVVSEASRFVDVMGYEGVAAGSRELSVPSPPGFSDQRIMIVVQNVETDGSNVTVSYLDADGRSLKTEAKAVPAHGQWRGELDPTMAGRVDLVRIESSEPVAAVVNQIGAPVEASQQPWQALQHNYLRLASTRF